MSVNEAFFVAETGQYHGDVYACVYIRTNSWLLLILLLRRFILDGSIGASKKTRGRTRPFRLDTRLQQREFFFNAPSDPLVLSMVLFWTLFLTILNCRIRMQIEFEKFSKTIILPHYHPPLRPPVLSNYQDQPCNTKPASLSFQKDSSSNPRTRSPEKTHLRLVCRATTATWTRPWTIPDN